MRDTLNPKLNQNQMLKYALEGEKISVSTPHSDNIAPCLLGGLTLIRDTESLDVLKIPVSNYYIELIREVSPKLILTVTDNEDNNSWVMMDEIFYLE